MSAALRWASFPVLMTAAVALALWMLETEAVAAPAVVGLILGPVGALVLMVERRIPFRDDWARSHGDIAADLGHNTISTLLGHGGIQVVGATLLVAASDAITRAVGLGLWPTSWPLVAQLPVALVIWEFGQYWAHRLSHETGDSTWWRWHAVHHSPTRLYFFNAGRDHPLGAVLLYGAAALPLYLAGADEALFAAITVFSGVHGFFQHVNADVRMGPLNYVFSSVDLHRWHHAVDIATANHNYGANLIVWDIVFGTRFLPPQPMTGPIGIGYLPTFPRSYWRQLAVPVPSYWRRLKAEGRPAAA